MKISYKMDESLNPIFFFKINIRVDITLSAKMLIVLGSILAIVSLPKVYSLDNGLALTPPMGWMSWERFKCNIDCENHPNDCISQKLIMRTADAMVSEGYAAAGYEYVIIDDCWLEKERDKDGRLVADRKRFPDGMKFLADYIHKKGLKFGIYEDIGTQTCQGFPGVKGSMSIDAQTFADWDVDYVKMDGCYDDSNDMKFAYPEFGKLLNATGRPMVYSCSWPAYQTENGEIPDYEALKKYCNLWRNWGDISNSWGSVTTIIDYFAKNQDVIQPVAGPGHWNDPDMLILGNENSQGGLNFDQSKAQMALWAVMASPLLMSTDLSLVKSDIKSILLNRDIIAINQDSLGIQGQRITSVNEIEIWTRPIRPSNEMNNSYAVAFVNKQSDGGPREISISLKEIGLVYANGYTVKDMYNTSATKLIVRSDDSFRTVVNPTGVQFYKFTVNF